MKIWRASQDVITFNLQASQEEKSFHSHYDNLDAQVVMAEHEAENTQVLQIATQFWLGYGLYQPKRTHIETALFEREFPKVILTTQNDPDLKYWQSYALVVFDVEHYKEEVERLIHFAVI